MRRPVGADDRARELMPMAAHDLRSPLAAIKMNATALERRWRTGERPSGAEWAAIVSRISRAADSACALVDDLLAIERLDYPFKPAAAHKRPTRSSTRPGRPFTWPAEAPEPPGRGVAFDIELPGLEV